MSKREAVDETNKHLERAGESAKHTGDKELIRKVGDAQEYIKRRIDPTEKTTKARA